MFAGFTDFSRIATDAPLKGAAGSGTLRLGLNETCPPSRRAGSPDAPERCARRPSGGGLFGYAISHTTARALLRAVERAGAMRRGVDWFVIDNFDAPGVGGAYYLAPELVHTPLYSEESRSTRTSRTTRRLPVVRGREARRAAAQREVRRRQRARQLKRVSLRKLKHAGALLQRSTAPAFGGGGAKQALLRAHCGGRRAHSSERARMPTKRTKRRTKTKTATEGAAKETKARRGVGAPAIGAERGCCGWTPLQAACPEAHPCHRAQMSMRWRGC